MTYHVYILKCKDGALYTGITSNLERRFKEHKDGKGGHYTSSNPPVQFLYSEEHQNRSAATKREIQIKGWTRTKKIALIKGEKWVLKAAARCRDR
ncbi:MAG: GIY-YIG nuclease family protein [Candidatus Saganbacteria bacterium]|nr:GIY-YIG nuclease family protein [Candidatus Saganbacteria bacterium]